MTIIQISIIIPVYNAEPYLEKAVKSALDQPQTGEVILVEDKSPDNCYALCEKMANENPKVKLYTHPNHENRGAGASRNLGMQKAKYPYIAFLDADDYYLPNRFLKTEEIFTNDPTIDGVYEACGFEFYSEKAKEYEKKDAQLNDEEVEDHLYTIKDEISPNDFFYKWMKGGIGYFVTDGITFKKSLLERVGYMDTELRLHQDTEFYYRLCALGQMAGGEIKKPVAIVGRHDNNRITNRKKEDCCYQVMVWQKLLDFTINHINQIDPRAIKYVFKNCATFYDLSYQETNKYSRVFKRISNAFKLIEKHPLLIKYLV